MVNPEFRTPFTPNPPFGVAALSTASLAVREHLPHNQALHYHRTLCSLASGEEETIHKCTKQAVISPIFLPQSASNEIEGLEFK